MKIISLFFFTVFAFADIVKIYATSAKEKGNLIYLTKPYLIYKDKFFIQAEKGVIKNKHSAVFTGNVTVFYQNGVMTSQKVEVVTKNNVKINYSFYYDKNIDVWFKNKIANIKNQKTVYFKDAIFSSCCVNEPDWYIFAKSGSYNKDTKYIKLYNMTLYVHNVPVFYLPFFFNSLNKERRSGLLRPYIGYSVKEGFLYSQPVYFATSLRTDLELTPTIRNRRGRGIYSIFRFVDSPYSFGTFKAGIFLDKSKFYTKYKLAHKKHFGYELEYSRNKIFDNDKLYADIKYANDVDFFYLDPKNYTFNQSYLTDKIITSKVNYLKNFDNSVLGIYNRYFIDTSLLSNDTTLQILPQINYHIFEKKHKIFLTSFDYNYYNYYRQKGKNYYINTFILPVGVNFNLPNHILNFKISEIVKGEYGNYYELSVRPSYYLNTYTQFKLYTSFTKNDDFLHIISPQITLNIKNYNKNRVNPEIMEYSNIQNSLSFDIFQIFQKNEFYLDHKFHQFYNIKDRSKEPMENQLNIKYENISFNDNNKYDWNIKKIIYNASTLSYTFSLNKISISHVYQYSPRSKNLDIRFDKGINKYKKIYFEYNYDMIKHYPKFWLFGIKLNKKCWQYDLSLKKSITPVLKEDGISYNVDYMISFTVNFYPIGGIKQSILFKQGY